MSDSKPTIPAPSLADKAFDLSAPDLEDPTGDTVVMSAEDLAVLRAMVVGGRPVES